MKDEDVLKKWARNWATTGPALAQIRKSELRQLSSREHLQAIDSLLSLGYQFRRPSDTSGLIEQQFYFGKLRA